MSACFHSRPLDGRRVSALLTPSPNTVVTEWLSVQAPLSVFTTAVTESETLYGLRLLPEGRCRRNLEVAILPIFDEDLSGRVLPFDRDAADLYATVPPARRSATRPISQLDAQIESIALSRGASVATCNVSDFEGIGVAFIIPWKGH